MKSILILVAFAFILVTACQDEGEFPNGYDHPCDYMLGRFEYLPTSLENIPYEGRTAVFFVDSMNNEIEFTISREFPDDKQAIVRLWPDMSKMYFCYESQPVEFRLINDSLDIQIKVKLDVQIDMLDPLEKLIADQVSVSTAENAGNLTFFLTLFNKTIDQRTFPVSDINTELDLYTCFGRTFADVEFNSFPFQNIDRIYYNDTEGIVTYIDAMQKKWCFDRFE